MERVGSSRLAGMFVSRYTPSADEMENAITQTVEAYTSMSRDKVGALMVFERQNLLDERDQDRERPWTAPCPPSF